MYHKIELARNQVRALIPYPKGYNSPEKLRYLAEIHVPTTPGSSAFRLLTPLLAAHRPLGNGQYSDAELYLEDYLKGQFVNPVPTGQESLPQHLLTHVVGAVVPFFIRYKREPLDQEYIKTETRYAINGGLSAEDFAGNVFTSDVLAYTQSFLTWQFVYKAILPEQIEYLDFLTNFDGLSELHLKVRYHVPGSEGQTITAASLTQVQKNAVYRCAVGFSQLERVLDLPDNVLSYDVWLENQNQIAVSTSHNFLIDRGYYRNTRFLMFQNGLGGYDTLCLTGRGQRVLSVKNEVAERFLPSDYALSDGQFTVTDIDGEGILEVNSGYVTAGYMDYLQDLFLSKKIYLLTPKGPVPYTLLSKDIAHVLDDETLFSLKLKLKKAYAVQNYSRTGVVTFTATESYTAMCGQGLVGDAVTRTATATSTVSQADAAARALSDARSLAEAALLCSFAPDGTFLREQCKPNTTELWSMLADGNGGERYGQLLNAYATECGFVADLRFRVVRASATAQGAEIILDDFTGGSTLYSYQWSYNGKDWTMLFGAGGYNNPQTVTVPMSGEILIYVRRGDKMATDKAVVFDAGQTGTIRIYAITASQDQTGILAPNQILLAIQNQLIGGAQVYGSFHYQIQNKSNGKLVAQGVFTISVQNGFENNLVTLPSVAAGSRYELLLRGGPAGYKRENDTLTY